MVMRKEIVNSINIVNFDLMFAPSHEYPTVRDAFFRLIVVCDLLPETYKSVTQPKQVAIA
jgi:hypothetical protein